MAMSSKLKTLVLCLKKVSLPDKQCSGDTEQDCARNRPWGRSARTHPQNLCKTKSPIIAPSPPDRSGRRVTSKVSTKRLKKPSCVRRLPLETATELSLVVSVPLSGLVTVGDQQRTSTVSTQTDPVFVGDYEEVRGLVREELSRTLRNLADELENTQQEVNKLQEEKKRLDALIHANSLLVHFSPSTISRKSRTSRGRGKSRGCENSKGRGTSRGRSSCARTRPRISKKQTETETTPVPNSTDLVDSGNHSSPDSLSDEGVIYVNHSPALDSSYEESQNAEQPLRVPCNTELPIETITFESEDFLRCLYELYSWLKIQPQDNTVSGCVVRSIKEPLQLLSVCLRHNAFDFSFKPIIPLLESAIDLFKKSNSQLSHSQVVDLPPRGVNLQELLDEVLQLLVQYYQRNPLE